MIQPSWPLEWLAVLRDRTAGNYESPLQILGGPLLLLAAVRWRRPEARLLLIMAVVPQSLLYYDQLPLGLVARSRNEAMLLVITGFIGYIAASAGVSATATPAAASVVYGPAILLTLYIPCLIMVLRRPNESVSA